MQSETLGFIDSELTSAGIPYEFMEFTSNISSLDYYAVGEYTETEPLTEDGLEESQFIITLTGRCSMIALETAKQKIKSLFPSIEGKTAILDNGSGVAIFYASAFPIQTGNADVKRLQINLQIKEWSVNHE